jgi:surface protein
MANSNGWGDGAANNTIGWGQGANNTIGWGSVYAVSSAGRTDIIGATPVLFTTEWTTTASSETIELPYFGGGTYSGTIDWGDGNTSANIYANRTHTYATAGTYTVVIDGTVNGWNFGNTFGSTYITSVVHWGQLQLGTDSGSYFGDCPNLDLSTVSDVLDLTGLTNLFYMFGFCTSLTSINRIGEWNTSGVTIMSAMFQGCDQINFNIGTWDVGSVSDFTDFMADATTAFSTTNLDAIYNGWSASGVVNDCSITFGTAQYTIAGGQAGKDILISVLFYNWTIIDGGGI